MPNFGVISSRTGFLASNVADLKLVADSLELVTNREEPFRAKKIAVWEDAGIIEPSPAIKRAVREASQALVQAGHHVEWVQDEVAQEAALGDVRTSLRRWWGVIFKTSLMTINLFLVLQNFCG